MDAETVLEREGLQPGSLEKIEEGWMKDVFLLDGENPRVVYLYRSRPGIERELTVEDRITAEKEAYNRIRESTGLEAPEVLGTDGENYLVCEMIPWNSLGEELEENETVAPGVAEVLSEIHSIELDGSGELSSMDQEWPEFLQETVQKLEKRVPEAYPYSEGLDTVKRELDDLDDGGQPVLLHGDPHPWNILSSDPELAVIDCEFSLAGRPGYDLARASLELPESQARSLIRNYRPPEGNGWDPESLEFYTLLHSTMMATDSVYLGDEEYMTESRERLEELLSGY